MAIRVHTVSIFLVSAIAILWWLQACRISAQTDTTLDTSKAKLGHYLFFDTRLSSNGTRSCGSCHDPAFAFSDGYRLSPNAPPLLNVSLLPVLDWADSTQTQLERQMWRPLFAQHPLEMGLYWAPYNGQQKNERSKPLEEVLTEFSADTAFQRLHKTAYPRAQGRWQPQHVFECITAYERTLISFQSPYDAWLAGDTHALTAPAKRGWQLFERSGCAQCHSGRLLTDARYYVSELTSDTGLASISHKQSDMGRFRTPTLRNIMLTAPYFHNGSTDRMDRLLATFAHGEATPHPKVNAPSWSAQDQLDLIHFFQSLTDTSYLQNPDFLNPYRL
jgi:cytochrome c peroxidase